MKRIWILFGVISVLVLSSCGYLPIVSFNWSDVGGWYRGYTNDGNESGTTHWTDLSGLGSFPIDFEMRKNSGASSSPFGIIFSQQADGSFYLADITLTGNYRLQARKDDGTWVNLTSEKDSTTFKDESANINGNHGDINTGSITYDVPTTTYTINLNGTPIDSFDRTALSVDIPPTGDPGFFIFVGYGPFEVFPSIPVSVDFKLTNPSTYP